MGIGKLFRKLGYLGRVLSGIRLEELNKSLNKAKERSGRNKVWLFLDMLWCAAWYGAGYHDYVMFGFYDMDAKHRDTYVTRIRNKKLITTLNDPDTADIFDHKTLFDQRFADYLGRRFLLAETMTFEEFEAFMETVETVFAKPDVGESGKGVERLNKSDFPTLWDMFDYIKAGNFGVVEEKLEQHEALQKLYPHSINTMRIVTLLTGTPDHWEPQCVYVVIKTGAASPDGTWKFVDNLENGGMFCPVDIETGKINGVAHTSALTNFTHHPNTGVEFIGYEIPQVKEAIELCKKAALEEPGMRLVGWDVAVSKNGLVIVEGNDYPGYDFWQQPEHTPDRIGLWPYYKENIPELAGSADRGRGKVKAALCTLGAVLLAAVLLIALPGKKAYTATTFSMGSYVQQTVYGKEAGKAAAEAAQAVAELDNLISWRVEGSDIDRLNKSGPDPVAVDARTRKLLEVCQDVSENSGGAFDATVGPVTRLWDFDGEPRVPAGDELEEALAQVDYHALSLPEGENAALDEGHALDLGAVGKGAACDEVIRAWKHHNVKGGVTAVGGSVGLHGRKPRGKRWKVAVRDPAGQGSLGELSLEKGCVSTSGSYEKTFTQNGETYHHLLDPQTGMPAESGLVSVTVWRGEEDGMDGACTDALSTACFVLGRERSLPLLDKYDAEAVFVTEDDEVLVTDGLKKEFSLTSDQYEREDLP